jgi:hypothetical protein
MSERPLPEKPAVDAPASPTKSKGASKGKRAPRPQRIRGKLRLKTKAAKLTRSQIAAPERQADQSGFKRIAPSGEGYVRLRIRVGEDGGASIVDSHFVESTLVQPPAIYGNFVYEVTEGEKRLHLDSIPDLGVFRSFVNPDGPVEERQHHIYELKTYDFDVRVPARELAAAALPKVAITLYRVKEARPAMPAGIQPLHVQYQRELREVAKLDGIPARILPEALRKLRGKHKSPGRK